MGPQLRGSCERLSLCSIEDICCHLPFFNLKEKLILFLSPFPFVLHFLQPYYLYLSSVRDGTQVRALHMLGKASTTERYVRSL